MDARRTRQRLLEQEDTDGDHRITIEDRGPQRFTVEGLGGGRFEVAGTQRLANLLEELTRALDAGERRVRLQSERIFENPVLRLSRRIREDFWDNLTRRLDLEGLEAALHDSKIASDRPRLYVPHGDALAWEYFQHARERVPRIEIARLPAEITPEYVRSLNQRPGLLCLALRDEGGALRGVPFVVPGGRFNEMYGWDSYFEALGLLQDGRVDLARAMVDNFLYQIRHYGRILNANRSYYLTRSQPPFLTAMGRAVYEQLPGGGEDRAWLAGVVRTAMREYHRVWMQPPRLTATGLSRYYGEGLGMPPETEPGHYDRVLEPFARRAGLSLAEYERGLRRGEFEEPELQAYFVHDHTLRESGHDNSFRLEGRAADLVTVDLNSLLYRYEVDIAELLASEFGGSLEGPGGELERAADWQHRAGQRKARMEELLWDPEAGLFFDYDVASGQRTGYESATAFYPLWAGLAEGTQAEALAVNLDRFEAPGGVLASTRRSRDLLGQGGPQRQWDYPFGWAPHQMLIWRGLERYGQADRARRLAYRWLYTVARNAADYNGTVPEKYDVVARSHKVFVEYGNVGTEFDYITREGFGWMNASVQVGLALLEEWERGQLEQLVPPEWLFGPAPVVD